MMKIAGIARKSINRRNKNQTWLRKKTKKCTQRYCKTRCLVLTTLTYCMKCTIVMKTTWMRIYTHRCRRKVIMTSLRKHLCNQRRTSVNSVHPLTHHLSTQSSQCLSSKIKVTLNIHQLWLTATSPTLEVCSQIRPITWVRKIISPSAHNLQCSQVNSLKIELLFQPLALLGLIPFLALMRSLCSFLKSSKERYQRYLSRFLMLPLCRMIFTWTWLIGHLVITLQSDFQAAFTYGQPVAARLPSCMT